MGGKSGSQTVGWRYYFGIQSGIGRGPLNEIREIKVGDKRAWIGSVKQNGRIYIDKPELFGGEEKEGGVQGNMDFYFGDAAQTIDGTDLETMIGAPQPGFRRMMTSFFDGLVCMNNPYPKTWKFRVRRTSAGWDGSVFLPDYVTIFLPWEQVPEPVTITGIINNFEGAGNGFFITMFRRLAQQATALQNVDFGDYEVINGANACGPVGRSLVYVVTHRLEAYDYETGALVSTYTESVGSLEMHLAYSKVTGYMYAINSYSGLLIVIDPATMTKVAEFDYKPQMGGNYEIYSMSASYDGNHIYLGGFDEVIKFNVNTLTASLFASVDLKITVDIKCDRNGNVYTLDDGSPSSRTLRKYNGATGSLLGTVRIQSGVPDYGLDADMAFSPNENHLFVPCGTGVMKVRLDLMTIIEYWLNPYYGVRSPTSVEITPDGQFLYVGYYSGTNGSPTSGIVSKIAALNMELVENITLQVNTGNMTRVNITPDGKRLFFTGEYVLYPSAGYRLSAFDLESQSIANNGAWSVNITPSYNRLSRPVPLITYGRFIHAMNPAHIIYECLTNREWGRGLSASRIDTASFTSAAMTLCGEEFGLCLKWTRKDTIGSFIQQVLDHIGAVVYTSRTTGLLVLKLIRSDYDINAIPFFTTETGLKEIREAAIAVKGSSVNQVQVTYHDPITDEDRTVKVTSQGALKAAGGIINSTSKSYPGLPVPSLALRVAQRDLRSASTNLRRFTLVLDRRASAVHPGEVIAIQDPKRGISKMALRVGKVDTGTLLNGDITLTCVQDVFGLPDQSFAANTPPVWQQPETIPSIFKQKVIEIPYYLIARTQSAADLATVSESAGFIGALNAQASTVNQGFQIAVRDGAPTADDEKIDGSFYIEFDV